MTWKDHPIIIFPAGVVAGFTFAWQVIFPFLEEKVSYEHKLEVAELHAQLKTATAELQQQQAENRQILLDVDRSNYEAQSLLDKIAAKQAIIDDLEEKISALQMGRVFDFKNPYPVDFQQIHVLDPIDRVTDHYNESQINREIPGFFSVKVEHILFEEVVYYYKNFPSQPNTKAIYQISYRMRDFNYEHINATREFLSAQIETLTSKQAMTVGDLTPPQETKLRENFLLDSLNTALGTGISCKYGPYISYAWTTPYNLTVYMPNADYDTFIVALEGIAPGSWRHPTPQYQDEASCSGD